MEHLQRGYKPAARSRQGPRRRVTKGAARLPAYRLAAVLILFVGFFLSGPSVQVAPASEKATVLLLNAYHKGLAWTDDVTRAVESTLNGHEIHVEYMDTKRHADERYLNLLRDLMFKKYQHLKVDVIISSDDHALSFLLEHRGHLFPGVPIVFCGVNDYSRSLLAGHDRITGVVEAFDIRETLGMALHLHPSSKKMVIVNDTTKTGLANKAVLERLLPEFSGKAEFEFLESMTMPDLLSTLQHLPSHTIVLMMSFNRDAAGRVFDYETSIKLISEKCRGPVYGIWDFYMGKGIVGGKLTSGESQGETAAALALEIIGGTRADKIPVVTQSPNRWMFDDRQLVRFNIDESRLPAGSEIVDRPRSVYREYRTIIWITLTALFLLASLSLFLLVTIEKRRRVEKKLRKSERQMSQIINFLPDPTFVIDRESRVIAWNRAMEDLTGIKAQSMLGKGNYEYAIPFYGERRPVMIDLVKGWNDTVASQYKDIKKKGALLFSETLEPHRPLGNRHFRNTAGPLYNKNGMVVGAIETIHDITERRAVEARIHESEKRYRTMFENTGTGTVLSEADTTLSMVNSEFASMVGYSREAIEGKMSWTQFIVPEDVERMKAYHYSRREDSSSTPTQWECSLVDRCGTVKQMLLKVRLIPGTQTSIGSFLDITERRQAEIAVVDANRMLRLVLDTIPVRVFWKDRAYRYEGCNQAFAEDTGQSAPEDLIGKDDYEMTWIEQADLYREDDRRVMATGDARINYEEPQTTPDGRTIWLQTSKVPMRDGQGQIMGVLGTYQDITERKNAVEELRRLRNYLTNIINSMPSVLVGVDTKGRVTQWNKQAELATGMTFEKARSQPLAAVFPQLIDEMDRIQSAIQDRRVLRDPKIPRHSNGGTRFEDITIFPLVANGVEGAVIRVDDVTERVRLEEMMIQSEKMLSVGGLAAGMAHEINNPLAGILQNAAVLDNRLFGDLPANRQAAETAGTTMAAIQQYLELRRLPIMLENIRSSGKRAAAIVRNMLSFARKSDRSVSSHDLGALLEQTVELAQTDYDMKKSYDFKHIQIVRALDDGVPPVPCEASKIQQVFLNILKNGAEAMADVADRRTQPTFTLRVNDDGMWVRVEIEDNGPGMDAKTRRRIFEPFFTTKPVGRGTGLGLSVSYFIITENHGGKMDVFSENGEGTRFVIRLPKKTDRS